MSLSSPFPSCHSTCYPAASAGKIPLTPALKAQDSVVFEALQQEAVRQENTLVLIASENRVSQAVLEAQGSILTNKYAEGYATKRYYAGCHYVDIVETLAIERACQLFGATYANVQPHSGSQANHAALYGLLKPGDRILSLSLGSGGHLTHGAPPTLTGKWFDVAFYHVNPETHLIDYDEILRLARQVRPHLIIAGASSYPRLIDFAAFQRIAEDVSCPLMVDMAHIAGLVAGGAIPSPVPHATVVTSTSHKTLRGPRGGFIISQHKGMLWNKAVFPGIQGGPLMHTIAAKAVCFAEAASPEFSVYAKDVIANAQKLSSVLCDRGLKVVTGGTDTHLILLDVSHHAITGLEAQNRLEAAGIICNKNSLPFDRQPPHLTSGIRLGTALVTSRGLDDSAFIKLGNWIADILNSPQHDVMKIRESVRHLCQSFPLYSHHEGLSTPQKV